MKKILTLCFVLLSTLMYSQTPLFQSNQEAIDRGIKSVNQSDLIFEGTVIEQYYYEAPNGKNIYTANVVDIHKIFKGQDRLSCGTALVITRGGVKNGDPDNIFQDYYEHG